MAAASVSLVVSSAWISRASAASSIVRGRVRSSTSTAPVTQHASCSHTESIRITPSNSPRPLSPAASNNGLRRGRSVGGEGGVVERGAGGRQRAREREFAAAGLQGAHQVDHAARPLRPSQRLHGHEVAAFPSGPQEPGQEQREIASVQRDPGAPTQRLQGIVEAGGHRSQQPAGVGGLQFGGGDPQVLGYLVELGGGGPQRRDVDRPDRLGGGQTQVVPAQRVRRLDHGQARLGGLPLKPPPPPATAAMLSPTIGRRLRSWIDGCPAAPTAEAASGRRLRRRAGPPRGRRSPPRPPPRPGRFGPTPRPGTSARPAQMPSSMRITAAVARPAMMARNSRFPRVLGPRRRRPGAGCWSEGRGSLTGAP